MAVAGKLLIMDDEMIIVISLRKALKPEGYEVEFAMDGKEVLELYKKAKESGKPFDAVLLDLNIREGMGGKEAMENLLQIDPQAKVVITSGHSDDPVMSRFRDFGFKGVISKPYTVEELVGVIKNVIDEN